MPRGGLGWGRTEPYTALLFHQPAALLLCLCVEFPQNFALKKAPLLREVKAGKRCGLSNLWEDKKQRDVSHSTVLPPVPLRL